MIINKDYLDKNVYEFYVETNNLECFRIRRFEDYYELVDMNSKKRVQIKQYFSIPQQNINTIINKYEVISGIMDHCYLAFLIINDSEITLSHGTISKCYIKTHIDKYSITIHLIDNFNGRKIDKKDFLALEGVLITEHGKIEITKNYKMDNKNVIGIYSILNYEDIKENHFDIITSMPYLYKNCPFIMFAKKDNEIFVNVNENKLTDCKSSAIEEIIVENSNNNYFTLYTKNIIFNKKVNRNEKCPCGSGKKYKKCCGMKK